MSVLRKTEPYQVGIDFWPDYMHLPPQQSADGKVRPIIPPAKYAVVSVADALKKIDAGKSETKMMYVIRWRDDFADAVMTCLDGECVYEVQEWSDSERICTMILYKNCLVMPTEMRFPAIPDIRFWTACWPQGMNGRREAMPYANRVDAVKHMLSMAKCGFATAIYEVNP